MFATSYLWAIHGRLSRSDQPKSTSGYDRRTVVIATPTEQIPTVAQQHEALLHHWSSKPHDVEVISVRPALAQDVVDANKLTPAIAPRILQLLDDDDL